MLKLLLLEVLDIRLSVYCVVIFVVVKVENPGFLPTRR